jgi:phage anti-repressor protein
LENKAIKIYTVKNKRVVRSFDFYRATGLKMTNYTRWLTQTVMDIGVIDEDYFPSDENVAGRTIRFRLRYYFEIEFAIALCLVVKRKEAAIQLRKFLIENK